MPPKGRLSPEEVADFETWIKLGAPDPRRATGQGSAPAPAPVRSAAAHARTTKHH